MRDVGAQLPGVDQLGQLLQAYESGSTATPANRIPAASVLALSTRVGALHDGDEQPAGLERAQ